MLQVRLLLEPPAIVLASRNLTPEAERRLQECVDDIDRAVSANDFYEVSRADLSFHQACWSICGNETLVKMLNQLCVPVFAFLMILMSIHREHLKERIRSHQELLDLMCRKDADKVEAAVRAHIQTSWHPFLDELK
jgi:DNA-binding GntR family transcriptional regulator